MANYLTAKELVLALLDQRAGKFSPLKKIFQPHLEFLQKETGLPGGAVNEIIFNALHDIRGRGECAVCGSFTKLYEHRGGWAQYCSRTCMNSDASPRSAAATATKKERGTGFDSPRVREKYENTMLQKYGARNPSLVPSIVKKRIQTCIDRFGETTPLKVPNIKDQIRTTMQEKYGGTGRGSKQISDKINLSARQKIVKSVSANLKEWEVITDPEKWDGSHSQPLLLRHQCGQEVAAWLWAGQHLFDPRCPLCHKSSRPQRKIIDFLESIGVAPSVNNRSIISPLELDVVLPSHQLAIEVNGLYYHGETSGKCRYYHLKKTEAALEHGYQLLHFSDFEINNRWLAVKTLLLAKLKLLPKLHARRCEVRKISNETASAFLDQYHLAGSCRSSIRLGLYSGSELVSVATFGRCRYESTGMELLRYCSVAAVRGGASKLISAFTKDYSCDRIVSYADRRWSQGGLYDSLGFELISIVQPGYWYFKGDELHHRTKFQKHKIATEDNSHLTEWQIMKSAGWDRYWDCGHLKYEKLIVGDTEI